MATTSEVYVAIESELMYQDRMVESEQRPDMIADLSPGDHLLAMEHCLLEARKAWYSGSMPHTDAAEHVRKVAALSVQFMKRFDAPKRRT